MILSFFTELMDGLDKTAFDMRKVDNPSRAQMPAIKLLSNSNTGKNINPSFNTQMKGPASPAPLSNPNFPYQKPGSKMGLRDSSVNKPSVTPNSQI